MFYSHWLREGLDACLHLDSSEREAPELVHPQQPVLGIHVVCLRTDTACWEVVPLSGGYLWRHLRHVGISLFTVWDPVNEVCLVHQRQLVIYTNSTHVCHCRDCVVDTRSHTRHTIFDILFYRLRTHRGKTRVFHSFRRG